MVRLVDGPVSYTLPNLRNLTSLGVGRGVSRPCGTESTENSTRFNYLFSGSAA
jgi:hypothetical protein